MKRIRDFNKILQEFRWIERILSYLQILIFFWYLDSDIHHIFLSTRRPVSERVSEWVSRARFCQSELIYVTSLEVSTTLKDCIEGPAGGLGSMPSVAKLCTNMWKLGVDTKSIQIHRGCHGCQWLSPVVNMLSVLLLYVFVLLWWNHLEPYIAPAINSRALPRSGGRCHGGKGWSCQERGAVAAQHGGLHWREFVGHSLSSFWQFYLKVKLHADSFQTGIVCF